MQEIVAKRTRTSKTYDLGGSKRQTVISTGPVHWQDDAGDWRDIVLEFRGSGADYVADQNDVHVLVSGSWPGIELWDRTTGKGVRWVTPAIPTVAGRKATFSRDGLDWEYTTTTAGIKLAARVVGRRGPQTYAHPFQLRGGAADMIAQDGALVGDGFRVIALVEAGGEFYPVHNLRVQGRRVLYDFDDGVLPTEVTEYWIDPTTTFTLAQTPHDAYVQRDGASYPPTGSITYSDNGSIYGGVKKLATGVYYIVNGLALFDTSSISPDVATDAVFRANVNAKIDADSRDVTIDWYNGAMDTSAYSETVLSDAHAGTSISAFSTGWQDITLINAGTGVQTGGTTVLRFHVSGGVPTGENRLSFWSRNAGTEFAAQLIVTHGPAPPPGGGSSRRRFAVLL